MPSSNRIKCALEQCRGITENLGEEANGNSWRFISISRLLFLASSVSELDSLTRPYFTGKSSGVLWTNYPEHSTNVVGNFILRVGNLILDEHYGNLLLPDGYDDLK